MVLNRAIGFPCTFRLVASTTNCIQFQVEASHFLSERFRGGGGSHSTEVEYIINDRPGELLTRKITLEIYVSSPRANFRTLSQLLWLFSVCSSAVLCYYLSSNETQTEYFMLSNHQCKTQTS